MRVSDGRKYFDNLKKMCNVGSLRSDEMRELYGKLILPVVMYGAVTSAM